MPLNPSVVKLSDHTYRHCCQPIQKQFYSFLPCRSLAAQLAILILLGNLPQLKHPYPSQIPPRRVSSWGHLLGTVHRQLEPKRSSGIPLESSIPLGG